MNSDYNVSIDLKTIKELLSLTEGELANELGVTPMTLSRWKNDEKQISESHLEKIYEFAFKSNIKLNKIKEQLYSEDYTDDNNVVLFHGSKTFIEGELSLDRSQGNKDFGKGFYCGESLEQSAMFVCGYPKSSLYIFRFKKDNDLKFKKFKVDRDWMLTIAYYRNKINEYSESKILKKLINELKDIDYIIAPIADNRMFQIIDDFIDGNITDVQCEHSLSATNLGYQYVFVSNKSLRNLEMLCHCYLPNNEKDYYLKQREEENKIGNDKVKIAKREYRGKGLYIDQLFK